MKYLLLNESPTNLTEFGDYIIYREDTGDVEFLRSHDTASKENLMSTLVELLQSMSPHGLFLSGASGNPDYTGPVWEVSVGSSPMETLPPRYNWFSEVKRYAIPGTTVGSWSSLMATLGGSLLGRPDFSGWAGSVIRSAGREDSMVDPETLMGVLDGHNIYQRYVMTLDLLKSFQDYLEGLTDSKRATEFLVKGSDLTTRYDSSKDMRYLDLLRGLFPKATKETIEGVLKETQSYLRRL